MLDLKLIIFPFRHLAALDFLQSITMMNEYRIVESKLEGSYPRESPGGFIDGNMEMEKNRIEDVANIAGGKKLDGKIAPIITIPPQFRYRMMKFNEQSAVIKNWEESVLRKIPVSQPQQPQGDGLLNSRAFFSRAQGYPICLMSVIGYAPEVEKARMEQRAEYILGANTFKIPQRDWRGISYRHCFTQVIYPRSLQDIFILHIRMRRNPLKLKKNLILVLVIMYSNRMHWMIQI